MAYKSSVCAFSPDPNPGMALGQVQWFMPIIPASLEAESRRIKVPVYPQQKVHETPFQ
jgi:hypothetical protein